MEPTTTAADWSVFRRQMPVARRWAYFDHAAVAPLSGPAQQALSSWAEDATANGAAHYPAWTSRVEHLRTLAADLIGAAARGNRPGRQHHRRHQSRGRGVSLEARRQRRHPGR